MKVADIFALLSLKTDKRSFDKSEAQINKFSSTVKRGLTKLTGFMKSQLGAIAGLTAVVFGVKNAHAFSTALVRLDVASKGALGGLDAMKTKILEVSDATGIAKEDVLQGTASFISLTGDAKTAAGAMELFAKVAQATGANIDDVARSGAALSQSMGIAGEDFEQAFSILIASGKAGSVELKDVSQVMAKLSAVSSQFAGGTGVGALAETGAALQLVTRAFGGRAKEGANALEKLMGSMVRAAPKLKKFGVEVFDIDPKTGQKTRREFNAIVKDIAESKLALDPTALIDALGSKEALAAFEQLTKVNGEWDALTDSTRNAKDVAQDYARVSKSAAVKATKAWNKFKNVLTRAFVAVLEILVAVIDHFEAIALTLGTVGIAFAIMSRQAIWAGIKVAAAWAPAVLGFILMTALLAALFLIFEDIVAFFQGKDSVLGTLFEIVAKRWGAALEKFFKGLERRFESMKLIADDFISFVTGKESKRERRARLRTAEDVRDFQAIRGGRTLQERFRRPEEGPMLGPAAPYIPQAQFVHPDFQPGGQGVIVNVTTGADPEESGVAVKRALEDVGRELGATQ